MIYQTVSLPMTFSDPDPNVKVTVFFEIRYRTLTDVLANAVFTIEC